MWHILKCAVQGIGHIDKDIPCQDKVYSLSKGGVTTIALADGAGSAKFSHFGAELITRYICEQFCERFDSFFSDNDGINVKKNLMAEITEQIENLAKEKNCDVKDLSSTLLFVSVKDNNYILAHIGDGIIGYLKGEELKVAQMPKKEGAVNETFFTTSSVALQQMQLIKGTLDTIKGFVLMSDGTETSLYDKRNEKLAEIIKKLMKITETHKVDVAEKLLTLSFDSTIKQQTTDDCSIIIMYNAEENYKSWDELTTDKLIKLFELNLSETNTNKDFFDYQKILKKLSKGSCSLQSFYAWFHINSKKNKEQLKHQLRKLEALQLIAEIDENIYEIFVK